MFTRCVHFKRSAALLGRSFIQTFLAYKWECCDLACDITISISVDLRGTMNQCDMSLGNFLVKH